MNNLVDGTAYLKQFEDEDNALELIAFGTPKEILDYAEKNITDTNILRCVRLGYQTNYKNLSEYRGAVIYIFKQIAREALKE